MKIDRQIIVASLVSFIAGAVMSYLLFREPVRLPVTASTPSHVSVPAKSQFGEIWQVYTFKPDVAATAYNSKTGNATIIWVSDFNNLRSEFGDIQQVYTFKPDVSATTYQSKKGDATIIWVSGMDDDSTGLRGSSF